MTDTEDELRRALHRAVADIQLTGDLERFLPPARARRRPRRSLLVVLPIVLVLLGTGAAAALPPLLANRPDTTQRLFIRTTGDGVDIRAYAFSGESFDGLEGDLSTERAVGLVFAKQAKVGAEAVRAEATTLFGTNGHDATAVAVHTGAKISMLRATFSGGGSDAMRPVQGWAVLAHMGPRPGGHVAAYNSRGRLVDLVPIPRPTNPGGPSEVCDPTFVRRTHQGILIVGHTLDGALEPDLADHSLAMVWLDAGLGVCRPADPHGLVPGVSILSGDGQPPGSMGPPITLVVVHSGTAVARVEVVFANHVRDSMVPVAGQAVLATLGTVANNAQLGTLEPATVYGFDKQGRRVGLVPLTPESNGSCVPSI